MRIVIKETIKEPDYYDQLDVMNKAIYDCKLAYVMDRLAVLKDEIEKEERENPKAGIRISMSAENINDLAAHKEYSPELSKRIEESFSYEDIVMLVRKLDAIKGSYLN